MKKKEIAQQLDQAETALKEGDCQSARNTLATLRGEEIQGANKEMIAKIRARLSVPRSDIYAGVSVFILAASLLIYYGLLR